MQTANPPIDRFERRVSAYPATPGMGPWDNAMRSPGPHISRDYGIGTEDRRVPGPGEDILNCRGAAIGLCADGRARHIRSYHAPQRFVGFHFESIDATRCLVKSGGLTWLFVHGLAKAQIGSPVYCDDADSFSIEQGDHGLEMGRIIGFEADRPGWAVVSFKAFDDPRPYPGPELVRRQR
jgi:hypothetical protein